MFFRSRFWYFLKLTRPLFLMGGFMLYLLGAAVAWREGAAIHPWRLLVGQLLVTSIQLMTHYANEYYDQVCDGFNEGRTPFSGGSGVLVSGLLTPKVALNAARICAGLGVAFLILAGVQVPVVFALGVLALLAAWFYSAPPLSLSGSGWGEVSASLVVALLVPLVSYSLQTGGTFQPTILIVTASLIPIHLAMLIAFTIPDRSADAQAGKGTIAVRLGTEPAAKIHNLALIFAFGAMLVMALAGWPVARFAWLGLPLAIWHTATFRHYLRPVTRTYLGLTMKAIGLFALSAALWLAGFAL